MAEAKQMTVIDVMAKASYEWDFDPDAWNHLDGSGKALMLKRMKASLEAILGWPLVNINIKVGKHIHMQPADVDLAITAVLRAILAEKPK